MAALVVQSGRVVQQQTMGGIISSRHPPQEISLFYCVLWENEHHIYIIYAHIGGIPYEEPPPPPPLHETSTGSRGYPELYYNMVTMFTTLNDGRDFGGMENS